MLLSVGAGAWAKSGPATVASKRDCTTATRTLIDVFLQSCLPSNNEWTPTLNPALPRESLICNTGSPS